MDIIFVHGAFVRDGAWWWQPVASRIERATGVASRAVALPSCGEAETDRTGRGGLFDDAGALASVLDQVDSAIVVAHSYGGTVVAQGGAHPAVRHLVYISSFLPDVGQTHASLSPSTPDPVPVRAHHDGMVSVVDDDRHYFDRRFLHDVVDPSVVEQAHARLCAQSVAAFATPTTAAAWQTVESTYLVCADDRSTDPELQRKHAARATHTHELPASHHPFLSRPELVAEELEAILSRTA
jgi:pimeloyl-ACP methyl ester carboxylesterase